MAHKLLVIAVGGLAVSAIALGAAAAISGEGIDAFDVIGMNDRPVCQFGASGHDGTRSIAWDGSDRVSIAVPADSKYRRGAGDQLVVSGDAAVIQHVRVEDGRIELDCRNYNRDFKLAVTLPGRTFRKFGIAGSGSLMLDGIDQPALAVGIAGSGNISGTGKTDDLSVHIAGSGKARLAQLSAGKVEMHIAGSGDSEIAPHDELSVHIAGSGKVRLASEPRHISTHIVGSGEILHGL